MQHARLVWRFFQIAWVLGIAPLRYAARVLASEPPADGDVEAVRAEREGWQGEVIASALESLGATFVKLGQILGSRPDLLPPGWLRALARLQDDVAPAPWSTASAVLREELGEEGLARFARIEHTPLAAASVAQVHVGALDTGEVVAIKVQRPEARAQIERDLFLMRRIALALDRIPAVRLLSLPGAVEHFGAALASQLDFELEARNNRRFAHNFRRDPKVRLPAIHDALSTRRVLTMQYVEGVKATQPERVGGDRRELAERGGRAILQMVFEDGFVHADLHPGNILLSDDGTMTFLDLGLVAEIPDDLKRPWITTFLALAQKDGAAAARQFYVYAPSVGTSDYDAYERDVLEYLSRLWDVRLGDVEVGAVVSGMMNVLRRHRIQIEPVFTVVNVALLVSEGLGKQLDPSIDLVNLAIPYLLSAQLTAPPGRAPAREAPGRPLPA
jgi:ubiquinone biosynthesis protein